MQLTFMLHYKIHGFLLMELTVRRTFHSHVFQLGIERAAMKAHSLSVIFEIRL